MIEISATPLIIIAVLGVAGVLLPVINVIRKEKGSNSFYAVITFAALIISIGYVCLLYTSPSPRDGLLSRMPSSA